MSIARPGLSIVMPVKNGAGDLPLQLAALAAQVVGVPWELVVADNGSTDATVAVVEGFRDRIPAVRVIDASAQPGGPFALNRGIEAALSDRLLFLDADDEVGPGYLEAMRKALDVFPVAGARLDNRSLNQGWVYASRPPSQEESLGTPFGFLPVAAGASLAARREVLDAVGGFDVNVPVCHDVDFCWRAHLAGFELGFVPEAVLRYRYRADLRSIYRQGVGYGAAGPLLYRRFKDKGMPRRSRRTALRYHGALVPRLARIRSVGDLAAWLFLLGLRVGVVRAAWRQRTLYL